MLRSYFRAQFLEPALKCGKPFFNRCSGADYGGRHAGRRATGSSGTCGFGDGAHENWTFTKPPNNSGYEALIFEQAKIAIYEIEDDQTIHDLHSRSGEFVDQHCFG